jgi:hypothetical protein
MKINEMDDRSEWVYLAYRIDDDPFYSHRMYLEGRKHHRSALYLPEFRLFVRLDSCQDNRCSIECYARP